MRIVECSELLRKFSTKTTETIELHYIRNSQTLPVYPDMVDSVFLMPSGIPVVLLRIDLLLMHPAFDPENDVIYDSAYSLYAYCVDPPHDPDGFTDWEGFWPTVVERSRGPPDIIFKTCTES